MISSELEFDTLRKQLKQRTRVNIADFLQADAARRLLDCLERDVPWSLAERSDGESRTHLPEVYRKMSPEERQTLLQRAYDRAASEFQFSYDTYMMVEAAKEQRDPGLLLHIVLLFLNSPEFLQFSRWFTEEPGIYAVNAQATRYGPGQFLTLHHDEEKHENRAFAYVINLTPRWQADFGGLLHFLDDAGNVTETLMPRYNSLNLFKVPQSHSVSMVVPWAQGYRYAITGWFLKR